MKDDATPLTPAATQPTKALLAAPGKDSGSSDTSAGGPVLGGLVLAVLAVVAFVLSRRRARLERRMQLVETLSLGPRRSVCLVRVDGRLLVMGVSEAGVQLLSAHGRDAQPEPIEPLEEQASNGFEQLLSESSEEQALRSRLASGHWGTAP